MEDWLTEFLRALPACDKQCTRAQLVAALAKLPADRSTLFEVVQMSGDWCVVVNLSKFKREG